MFTSIRSRRIPALLTRMSSRPNSSTACRTSRSAPAKSATFSPLVVASPPPARISSTTCCAGPRSEPSPAMPAPRSLTMTLAPARASASACERPMPRPAPVTIATLPLRSGIGGELILRRRSAPGNAGSRSAADRRRRPLRARASLRGPRRRGFALRAPVARRRPREAASSALAGRCRARSAPRAAGSGRGGLRAWGGPLRRGTPRSPPRARPASAARSRYAPGLEQMADLVLDLGAEPPEDGELAAPVLPGQVALRLCKAADRPADVAGELPVVELLGPDVEPGQLVVALEIGLDIADPSEPQPVRAEAPRADEREREIARGIVEVRELPVEHADEPAPVDHKIPDPEVAVDDDGLPRRRSVLAQPPEPELDCRVRLPHPAELVDQALDGRLLEERQPLRRQGMDLRELVRHLHRQLLGHRPADDAAPDLLALQPLHDERLAPLQVRDVRDRPRHSHARLVRGLQHLELVPQRERVPVDHAAPRTAHEQLLPARVDGPRLLRRAAGQQQRLGDGAEHRFERVAHL